MHDLLAGCALVALAWNQHDDLFGYEDSRALKGVEYIAKYNLGQDVPYTTYSNSDVTQSTISSAGRGNSPGSGSCSRTITWCAKDWMLLNLRMADEKVRRPCDRRVPRVT